MVLMRGRGRVVREKKRVKMPLATGRNNEIKKLGPHKLRLVKFRVHMFTFNVLCYRNFCLFVFLNKNERCQTSSIKKKTLLPNQSKICLE